MFCGMCGKPIGSEVNYCPHCGAAVVPVQPTPADPPKSRKKHRTGRIVFGIISAIVILVAGILVIRHIRQKTQVPAPILTVTEAQEQLDAALESVYENASSDNAIAQTLADTVRIEVVSVEPSADGFSAECEVTAPDLATALSDYVFSLDTVQPAAYSDIVDDLLGALRNAAQMEETFRVEFMETGDGYELLIPEEMVVFCSGNAQDLLPLLDEHFQGGGES